MLSRLPLFFGLLKIGLKTPIKFIKSISYENLHKFFFALKNGESYGEILKNTNSFFKEKHNLTVKSNRITKSISLKNNKKLKSPYIFISHEATQTGAPLIILKIASIVAQEENILPIFILCNGGEIVTEFEKVGKTFILSNKNNVYQINKEFDIILKKINNELGTISKVYINSVESDFTIPYLKKLSDSKIIYLIHELGSLYPKNSWEDINYLSDHIVFPAKFVKESAIENTYFDIEKVSVMPQGLLKPEIFNIEEENNFRKLLCEELEIPVDSFIILGCGTPIARKGIDLFTTIAINVLNKDNNGKSLFFLWIGGAPKNDHYEWVKYDVKQSKMESQILFVGEKKDTIPYFLSSDLFLMTSRGDPFPCVVQEALAAGLPVLTFENTGGHTDLIKENILGEIFPYLDIPSMVISILEHSKISTRNRDLNKTERRSFSKKEFDFNIYVKKLQEL